MFAAISAIASFPHFICALYSVALHELNTHSGIRENEGISIRKRKTTAQSRAKEREIALNTCKLTDSVVCSTFVRLRSKQSNNKKNK